MSIEVAINHFAIELASGRKIKQSTINQIMGDCFGNACNNAYSLKQATDLVEAATVKFLLRNNPLDWFDIQKLQKSAIHQNVRSDEQIRLQQFSTPVELAYLLARTTHLTEKDLVLEPSAGTGILPAIASNQFGNFNLILNEISPFRQKILKECWPESKIYSHDGEYINDLLPRDTRPTVVLMNPPFNQRPGFTKRSPDVCYKHLRSALLKLQTGGRLAAIVAHWLSPEKYPQHFADLPAQCILSVLLDGSFYKYHGTNFCTRLLVFDRISTVIPGKSLDRSKPHSMAELLKIVEDLPPRLTIEENPVAESLAPPNNIPKPNSQLSLFIDWVPVISDRTTKTVDKTPKLPKLTQSSPEPNQSTPASHSNAIDFPKSVKLIYRPRVQKTQTMVDGVYQVYEPSTIEIPGAAPHPTPLAESVAMAAISAPLPTVEPVLPATILERGLASEAQLESLIYACEAHSKTFDTPWIFQNGRMSRTTKDDAEGKYHRQGFFIGDGTGCGKGLMTALIILANWCEGRKRAIWVSKNDTLIEDARRDWQRLGGDPYQIVPLSKIKQGDSIQLTEGILFVTYGTLRSPAKNDRKSRVQQIIDWLGEDFDGCICFDESHLLGNCAGEEGEYGAIKASAQGMAGMSLVDSLPDARVTYLSATGAAKVSNLSYCQRLGLWRTDKFPFNDRKSFLSAIDSAGVAGLEMVAQDLKRMGLYIARTLSFEGVKYDTIVHNLTAEQQNIWDTYCEVFMYIHQNMQKALKVINGNHGSKARAVATSCFESTKQRFFNSLLCAFKAPTLIDAIEVDLNAGHACVIQMVSTGESLMTRRLAGIPPEESQDLRAIDFTARESIMEYLMESFPIHLYEVSQDENGNIRSELMLDEDGRPIQSQEALSIRQDLIERVAVLPSVNSLLDSLIWHFGVDNIAEITGRSQRIVYQDDRYQLVSRPSSSNKAETDSFQCDEKKILIFSQAGGTGRSYHADKGCKNQRLRRHYLVEPGWQAISAVQGFGRSHRSNQAQPPEFVLLTTNVKGEVRFTATIASRLSALGAITKGQRNTGNNGVFDEETGNFTSDYAQLSLGEFIQDLRRFGVGSMTMRDFEKFTGLEIVKEGSLVIPSMTTFLNRLLALPIDIQNLLFEDFQSKINARIELAKEKGTYDRGVETLWSSGGFEIVDSKVIQKVDNSETICYEIDRITYPILTSAEQCQRILNSESKWCGFQDKSGKVAMAKIHDRRTKRSGNIVDVYRVYQPVSLTEFEAIDADDFTAKWQPVTIDKYFWSAWKLQCPSKPEAIRKRLYLVCGLLLPLWRKLGSHHPKIFRLQTNDGKLLLGRKIEIDTVQSLYEEFQIESEIEQSPEAILDLIWNQKKGCQISKDFYLFRCQIKGNDYLQVLTDPDNIQSLESWGCFSEIIDWKKKVFVPVNRATEIILKMCA